MQSHSNLLFFLSFLLTVGSVLSVDPDEIRTLPEIIASRGFTSVEYDVTTEDGYVLSIFRIVNPTAAAGQKNGKPVLLMHPFLGEGSDWLINSPDGHISGNITIVGNNLGFELAKRGYDVWIGNVRGNTYGRRHTHLSPHDDEFWKFSIDHHSHFDLPAIIHFVLQATGVPKIDYVGHSQGSLIMFAHLSQVPESANLIDHFIAMGPAAYMAHVTTPLRHFLDTRAFRFYLRTSSGPFFPSPGLLLPFSRIACRNRLTSSLCRNILFLICGYDANQMNVSRMPVYVSKAPAGSSKQNILHYVQMIHSKKFQMFDYGSQENVVRYGMSEPPAYNVSLITHPKISLLWGGNDALADPRDVQHLKDSLTVTLADDYRVPCETWNHIDFLWAKETGLLVNTKVLEILSRK